jgi:hypothetical protein
MAPFVVHKETVPGRLQQNTLPVVRPPRIIVTRYDKYDRQGVCPTLREADSVSA